MLKPHENDPVERERLLDANRAIAQKIRNRLNQLVNANEKDKRRWVWELLQNAKDTVTDRKVDIEIELSSDSLEFKHNGDYFSPRNLTNLVHQISSKEGTDSIGRFGTGFLTTHTLSRLVQVNSVYTENNSYFSFEIMLDRRGSTEDELMKGIQNSWDSYAKNSLESAGSYLTKFKYIEPNNQLALDTINDFKVSIFYTLAFVQDIGKIVIKDKINQLESEFYLEKSETCTDKVSILKFAYHENDKIDYIYILHADNGDGIQLAVEVDKVDSKYRIKPIPHNVPHIFCAFPLVGTEEFPFPLIINSIEFSPKTERDGLYLQGKTEDVKNNKDLLQKSLSLYQDILNFTSENKWLDLYILAYNDLPKNSDDIDRTWYENMIQSQLHQSLLTVPIVETVTEDWVFISGDNNEEIYAFFPYDKNKEVREFIWKVFFLLFPDNLPKKEHIHDWYKILWSEDKGYRETLDELASDISILKSLDGLSERISKNETDTLEWINAVVSWFEKYNSQLLDKYPLLPNQYGILKLKNELYIDDDIPNELKDIIEIIGQNWRDLLLHKSINTANLNGKSKTINTLSKTIDEYIDLSNNLNFDPKSNSYKTEGGVIYSQSEFEEHQEKTRLLVFGIIGYSGVNEITQEHSKIWEFARSLYYEDVPDSIKILAIPNKCNLHQKSLEWLILNIASDVSKFEDIETLGTNLHGHIEPIEWLNNFISFIHSNKAYEKVINLDDIPILPNQDGVFHSKDFVFRDDNIDNELKEILRPLSPEWVSSLLDKRICVELSKNKTRNFDDIEKEIDETVRRYYESRKTQDPVFMSTLFVGSLRSLFKWVSEQGKSKQISKKYFNWIYQNKAELSVSFLGDEKQKDAIFDMVQSGNIPILAEISNNFSGDQLQDLAKNPDRIREFLNCQQNEEVSNASNTISLDKLSEVLGQKISSIEDLEIVSKQGLVLQGSVLEFKPEPSKTSKNVDFEAISQSNEEAKNKVKKHLESQSEYDLTGWHEESNTIIGGVKRQGINIKLVIKGANSGVIYFDRANKEKQTLKKSFTELWVYNKGRVLLITIGKVLEDGNIKSMNIKGYL